MANGFFERFAANTQSAASKLRVKSALNPMLWLCAIASIPCYVLAYFAKDTQPLESFLLYAGTAPIVATTIGFLYFMIRAPEKLQSEEYQLRHESLQLIKQKGSSIEISPSSLEAIANPLSRSSSSRRRR